MPQGQKIVLLLKAYCFEYDGLDLTTSRVFEIRIEMFLIGKSRPKKRINLSFCMSQLV